MKLSNEGILTIFFNYDTKLTFSLHMAMILGVNSNPFDSNTNYREESVKCEIGSEANSNNEVTGGLFYRYKTYRFQF